ncbi:hypothetical protein [Rhodoplanes sp. Z2-YC6860]|uniref:hypothetical protein n=1 Tax=Rhodoplanes sp. Z2-YC6860 TaxID=674703 RepID=UPI00078EB672|nr:hypothetical protein [Rhodoplanes sp. Z2-YC6860]AMN42817.1 hypothetical protein RHPLAN_43880 [Rhodoplanes sp. Z2-YC6860]
MRIFPTDYPELFNQRDLADTMSQQEGKIEWIVNDRMDDALLATPTEDLVEHVYKQTFIPPLTIYREQGVSRVPQAIGSYLDEDGHTRHSLDNGFKFEVAFPFIGARGMFNHWIPNTPGATILKAKIEEGNPTGSVLIAVYGEDLTQEAVKQEIDGQITKIIAYVLAQNVILHAFNEDLRTKTREYVEKRKRQILNARHIAASLGYQMVRREDAPPTYITQELQRIITPRLITPPRNGVTFDPEPTIDEGEYQHILEVLSGMARLMERSPRTFAKLKEEEIRDHFLLQLNGHYKGNASGETFNRSGKTDILVREKDRNLFIGECKIWSTEQGIKDAVDQLLDYLTWRDTKAALVVFVKRKGITQPLKTIMETVAGHPAMKRGPQVHSESRQRFTFGKPDDPTREIFLTVMVFHIPDTDGLMPKPQEPRRLW